MSKFNAGQSFADGDTVTGAKLNNIAGLLDIYTGLISEQTAMVATVSTADQLLIADVDNGDSGAANRVTVQKLLNDGLTNGTFSNLSLTGNLNVTQLSTLGTINNTRGTVGILNSTTGTIQSLTSSTANISQGSAIFTQGTINTLNCTTGTIGTLNNTTGTIGTLVATGTITGSTNVVNIGSGQIYKNATGNFGLGTTSPNSKLHIATGGAIQFDRPDGANQFRLGYTADDSALKLNFNAGSTLAVVDNSGNVGIGVAAPDSKLSVYGANTSDSGAIYTANILNTATAVSGVGSGLVFGTNIATKGTTNIAAMAGIEGVKENGTTGNYASALKFTTRANLAGLTEKMRIDSSGNVGIGITSPVYRLSSKQSGNTGSSSLGVVSINSANDTFIGIGYDSASDTNRVFSSFVSTGAFKPITLHTSDSERLRIDSSGNVSIGTATALSKLHVHGDLTMSNATVSTTAATGGFTLPATAAGYLTVSINGTSRKIPYYA